jgi:hypothetical protein
MYPMTPPTTPKPALCPHCGAPLQASTPAATAPTMPAPSNQKAVDVLHDLQSRPIEEQQLVADTLSGAPVKQQQSWRDREPLL